MVPVILLSPAVTAHPLFGVDGRLELSTLWPGLTFGPVGHERAAMEAGMSMDPRGLAARLLSRRRGIRHLVIVHTARLDLTKLAKAHRGVMFDVAEVDQDAYVADVILHAVEAVARMRGPVDLTHDPW